MKAIDWSQLDDYLFVKLIGELIARLGFVDIDYQGEGPDGGIDLFATELLPFTIQGRIPFRWAIQCKFSVKGATGSVNDSDVQDVEGILRSDRYAAQNARGYLLVTNRRIVQNVIERLRGIDRKSQFRTGRIDGSYLDTLLSEHPQLVERVFGEKLGSRGLGKPDAIILPTHGSIQSEPLYMPIEIRPPNGVSTSPVKLRAIIDTGASMTCIPVTVVRALALSPTGMIKVASATGSHSVGRYDVQIAIERLGRFTVPVVAVELDTALIGRDILSRFSVLIHSDGGISFYKK